MSYSPIRRRANGFYKFDIRDNMPLFIKSDHYNKLRLPHRCEGPDCQSGSLHFVSMRDFGKCYASINKMAVIFGLYCSPRCASITGPKLHVGIEFFDDGVLLSDPKNVQNQENLGRSNARRLEELIQKAVKEKQDEFDRLYEQEVSEYNLQAALRQEAELVRVAQEEEARKAQLNKLVHYGEQEKAESVAAQSRELQLPELRDVDCEPYKGDDAFDCSVCDEGREHKYLFSCGHGPVCVVCVHGMAARAKEKLRCHVCDVEVQAVIQAFF